jgi:hypothetical protein
VILGRRPCGGKGGTPDERDAYDTGMNSLPSLNAEAFAADPARLAEALRAHGACWIADWPPPPLRDDLRDDLRRLQACDELAPADGELDNYPGDHLIIQGFNGTYPEISGRTR